MGRLNLDPIASEIPEYFRDAWLTYWREHRKAPISLRNGLMIWAKEHHPDAVAAYLSDTSPTWRARCLASMFRRRAADSPQWLYAAVVFYRAEVLELAPAIQRVAADGQIWPPAGMTWAQWIDSLDQVEQFTARIRCVGCGELTDWNQIDHGRCTGCRAGAGRMPNGSDQAEASRLVELCREIAGYVA